EELQRVENGERRPEGRLSNPSPLLELDRASGSYHLPPVGQPPFFSTVHVRSTSPAFILMVNLLPEPTALEVTVYSSEALPEAVSSSAVVLSFSVGSIAWSSATDAPSYEPLWSVA